METGGVEERPRYLEGAPQLRRPHATVPWPAVQVVTDDGVADVGQVDAELVGAAGSGLELDERHVASGGEHAIAGEGGATPVAHRHSTAIAAVGGERKRPLAGSRTGVAPDEGQVGLFHPTVGKGVHEIAVRLRIPGQEDDPRGPRVQAVDEEQRRMVEAPCAPLGLGKAREEASHGGLRFAAPGGQAHPRRFGHGHHALVGEEKHGPAHRPAC